MVLALFMVESVWAVHPGSVNPRMTDGRLGPGTSYDDYMESFPEKGSPVPHVHPLEIPFVWFGLQLVEYAIVWLLMDTFLPETTSAWAAWAIFLVLIVGLTIANYRIRRRFIPR